MLRRLFALLLSALLALAGSAAAAWPALAVLQEEVQQPALVASTAWALSASGADTSAVSAPQGVLEAFDPAVLLQAGDGAAGPGTGDDWTAPTPAEWLFDVSALPPVAPSCLSNGLRGAPPPNLAQVRYQPPDLEGPQRPPRALIG